ncbi:MAG: RNA polymerase sigma-70 factor [Bacteroidota bacterium]
MDQIDFIIQRLKKGDEQAFDQLYSLYGKKVFHVAYSILKTEEDAYEVVQETFLKLWFKRHDLNPAKSIDGYLSTIARNFAFKVLKKSLNHSLLDDFPEVISSEGADDLINLKEFQQKLDTALSQLPPRSREVLLMSRYEGLSNSEIAERLGISLSTVNNHIHKALSGLKDHLQVPLILLLICFLTYSPEVQIFTI